MKAIIYKYIMLVAPAKTFAPLAQYLVNKTSYSIKETSYSICQASRRVNKIT
jgi:hypothetical protein